jgi:hypothetical protein
MIVDKPQRLTALHGLGICFAPSGKTFSPGPFA